MLADGIAFVVPTAWAGETVLRICIVNPRTTVDDIRSDPRLAGRGASMADLLIRNARLVATVDAQRRELAGGWVAITGNLIEAVGGSDRPGARGRPAPSTRPTAW